MATTGDGRERVRMSGEEIRRLRVVQDVISRRVTQAEAADLLGLSVRQLRRIFKRVKAQGELGVVHGLAGKKSNRALKSMQVDQILALWNNKYRECGLNFTHFTEKLNELEKLAVGRESVRKLLRSQALCGERKVKKAGRHRKRRERRERFGELLQQDTSPHDWLGTGEIFHLVANVDDSGTQLLHAELFHADGTLQNLKVLKEVFRQHGLPVSIYTDKAAWFHHNAKRKRMPFDQDAEVEIRPLTQIGRGLKHLGVEMIVAHSPQAKGRIERMNGTLQDRLISELKIEGIREIQQANRFIRERFIPDFNLRFAKPPASLESAFVRLADPRVLDEILCLEFPGQVQNDNTVTRQTTNFRYRLQCGATAARPHWAKAPVRVRITTEGELKLAHAGTGEPIPFEILELKLPEEPKYGKTPFLTEADISIWQKRSKTGHS